MPDHPTRSESAHGPTLDPQDARQAAKSGRVRNVLVFSLGAAIIALAVVYFLMAK